MRIKNEYLQGLTHTSKDCKDNLIAFYELSEMKNTERIRFIGGRHVINSNRNTNFNSFPAKRTLLLTLELCLANDSFVCGARQKNLRSAYAGIFLLPEKPSQNRLGL